MATWVKVMRTSPDPQNYPTTEAWNHAMEAWSDVAERQHGRQTMRHLASLHKHFNDETTELWVLTHMVGCPLIVYTDLDTSWLFVEWH
jgi:hypothetical protein